MIQYVDDYINDDWEEGVPTPDDWGEGYLKITAEDQSWNKETLKQLREEYDVTKLLYCFQNQWMLTVI